MVFELKNIQSRAATCENPCAEKGNGGRAQNGRKGSPCISPLKSGETAIILYTDGPGIIRHIWMTVPPGNVMILRNLILRMYWEGSRVPSVEVPVGDFFGVSHGQQKNMNSEFVSMQDARGFNCYIPMPFRKRAVIKVENDSGEDVTMLFYQIDFTLGDELGWDAGYFHAQFRRQSPCPMHKDYVILDGVFGRGVYLGTVLGIRSLYQEAWWGEGEVKFFLDGDVEYPTICGTGAEDYMGSAWGLNEVLTPYQGCPLCDNEQGLYSIYRFHGKDPIYFQQDLRVTVQQIGYGHKEKAKVFYGEDFISYPAAGVPNDSQMCYFDRYDDYSSVAYWYQETPTKVFPVFPDRAARSAWLNSYSSEAVKRNDI